MIGKEKSHSVELLRTIAHAWLNVRRRGRKTLVDMEHELTFEQFMVLLELHREDGLELGTLAEHVDRERTTVSRMIDGLEKRNLAVRVVDKVDKRHRLVYLTKLGKQRIEQLEPVLQEFACMALTGVTKSQLQVTLETLRTIIANAERK